LCAHKSQNHGYVTSTNSKKKKKKRKKKGKGKETFNGKKRVFFYSKEKDAIRWQRYPKSYKEKMQNDKKPDEKVY